MNTLDLRECSFKSVPDNGRKLIWEVTHTCHFGCPYCFQAKKRESNRQRVLHTNDLRIIGEKLTELNVTSSIISGGEIFHIKDILPEICTDLQNRNIPYSFSTYFINDIKFIDNLLSYKPKALNLSLDPQSDESKEKYDNIVLNICKILEMSYQYGVKVKLTGVITQQNIMNVINYIKLIEHLSNNYRSLTSVFITNPYDIGYVKTNVRANERDLRSLIKNIRQNDVSSMIKFINFHRFNFPLQKCFAGDKIIHIEPDGNVYPCYLFANFPDNNFLIGNIVTDSVNLIAKKLESFSRQASDAIGEYKSLNSKCPSCSHSPKCGGGCLAEILSIDHIRLQLICKKLKPHATFENYKPTKQIPLQFKAAQSDLTSEEDTKIAAHIIQHIRSSHDLAHGFDHVISVVRLARHIGKAEGANLRIVTAAAYFHDFEPRRKLEGLGTLVTFVTYIV